MMAFNVLLRQNPELHAELPYKYGVIWWDHNTQAQNPKGERVPAYALANTLHFCNDQGKKARAERERMWIW
jgi:hypothetical protein